MRRLNLPGLALLTLGLALSLSLGGGAGLGCAGSNHTVRRPDPPAPLDREIAALPNAHGYWMPDPEYGGKLYVIEAGPAAATAGPAGAPALPTLVLVHGLGDAGVKDFYALFPELARKRHVVAFDLPGFGRSGRINTRYAPERYAAVLFRVIESYGDGQQVDVLGHSMGGAIAMLHAASYPGQVRRLVVVDSAGILHREAWFGQQLRRVTDPTGKLLPWVAGVASRAASALVDTTRHLDPAPDLMLESALLREHVLGGEPGRIAALSLLLYDFGSALSKIEAPTLLVWGADDTVAPLRTGQLLADRIRGASLVVIPGAGHELMTEAPAPVLAAVVGHLDAADVRPPVVPPEPTSQGPAVCNGSADIRFQGVYDSVVLDGCAHVILDHVRAATLVMKRSSATVVGSSFGKGIVLDGSELVMTGGRVGGELGLDVKASKIDLAGVAIEASRQACQVSGESRVLFSVCPVQTGPIVMWRHGFGGCELAPKGGS
jgi:pimeloyl-ACP methyl ester carboxylesterase